MKNNKRANTPSTSYLKTENYGSGIKNPVGKLRDSFVVDSKTLGKKGKPPKSLA